MRRSIWQATLVGLGFALGMSAAATADQLFPACTDSGGFDSTVTQPNQGLGSFSTGPYAEICITLTSSTTATVEAETFPGFLMGAAGALDLNFNIGAGETVALSSGITGDAGSGPFTATFSSGGKNVNGFGKFNFVIDDFDGFGHATSTMNFSVMLSGGTWPNSASVLAVNGNGADAEMHIFVTSRCNEQLTCTGFAAEGPGTITETPEPGVLSLLAIGLLGLGVPLWRSRRKT